MHDFLLQKFQKHYKGLLDAYQILRQPPYLKVCPSISAKTIANLHNFLNSQHLMQLETCHYHNPKADVENKGPLYSPLI